MLSGDVIEEKRRQALRFRKRGMIRAETGEIIGVQADTVGRWLKLNLKQLKVNRGGCDTGEGRRLTAEQENMIREQVVDKTPDQLKMPDALWTRKAVMEPIKRETGIDMPVRTAGEYLERWGFTPQMPVTRAYKQNSKAVLAG